MIAAQEGVGPITEVDETQLLVLLLKSAEHKDQVDWSCFYFTISEWVITMTSFAEHLQDCEGNMSLSDREVLHQIVRAFFI